MAFTLEALGQSVTATVDVFADRVRATVDLPPMLALLAEKIRNKLLTATTKLLR